MRLSQVIVEDFVNYKKPSLFLGTCFCDWKCCREGGFPISVCQNHSLCGASQCIDNNYLLNLFTSNPLTEAIVVGGLEPFKQFEELFELISYFRKQGCYNDFVIYTGYDKHEIDYEVNVLRQLDNVIIKFGRYIPEQEKHYDSVLGVYLASNNQYAERL